MAKWRVTPVVTMFPIPGQPVAWLLLLVATLLRFYHLGHQSIWVDEYTSFLVAKPFGPLSLFDLSENR